MEKVVLEATRRTVVGKQVKALRREGKLPAVIYGTGVEPTPILLDQRDTSRTLSGLSATTLITINLEGLEHLALIREKQRNIILGSLTHIDFQAVSMTQKLRVNLAIRVIGESPAIKNLSAILVTPLEEIEIECFPQDLPDNIKIDISSLKNFGDSLSVRDLVAPPNVTILEDPNETVVLVAAPAAEQVEAVPEAAVAAPTATEPEVIEKGKKEEEEF